MDIKNSFKGLRSKDTDVKAKSWAIYVWLMVILMSAIDFFVNPNINQFFESLAMGIFGGALFAILPYMFIKFFKKTLAAIALLTLLIGIGFYSNQAVKITEYQDLKLGMSMDEVIYAMGEPGYAMTLVGNDKDSWCPECPTFVEKDEIKKAGGIKNFLMWGYSYPGADWNLEFDLKKKLIEINCKDMRVTSKNFKNGKIKLSEECQIGGIHTQSTEKEVIEVFGEPSQERIDKAHVKHMTYKNRNLELLLSQKKVYFIIIREI